MINSIEIHQLKKSAEFIENYINDKPKIAIVLGTGLGAVSNRLNIENKIPYEDIPYFPVSTVESHAGELLIAKLNDISIICLSGRWHYYEGYDYNELSIPIRVLKLLGIEYLILTNAAGGIDISYKTGDVMLINDHINFVMASPVRGKHIKELGDRFFDMTAAYDKELIGIAKECAKNTKLRIHEGVYAYTCGPHFETCAEIRFFRMVGCNAVGMSTVPEIITAKSCGIRSLAISLITNMASGVENKIMDGSEVDEVAFNAQKEMSDYVCSIIEQIKYLVS